MWSFNLVPIRQGDDPNVNEYQRGEGISGLVALYTNELKRLAKHDKAAARREVKCWPEGASIIFPRLRIWALGEKRLISKRDQVEVLKSISREAFWHTGNQRDLLTSLSSRWSNLSNEAIKIIERYHKRLVKSLADYPDGEKKEEIKIEIDLVKPYLPQKATEAETLAVIESVIKSAEGQNFGVLMKTTLEKIGPTADGKLVSQLLKQKLSS
jgi:uncharacterized protein YqeY